MKISHFAAAATGVFLLNSAGYSAEVTPEGLKGVIESVEGGTVEVDSRPMLDWKTSYPTKPPIGPTPIPYRVKVRVIGQGVTGSNSPGTFFFAPTHATMSINTSNFTSIFFGTNPEVKSDIIDLEAKFGSAYHGNIVPAGTELYYGGYYQLGNDLGTHYKSNDGGDNIRFLRQGDTPPTNVPDHNAPSLESFLRPYLDTTGKVAISKNDVIVFMELTHTAAQKSEPGYDLQDMVLLVTYEKP